MEKRNTKIFKFTDAVIRICHMCGVVNPAGPSWGCPHLQLIRFDGVDEQLEEMLEKVAKTRKEYIKVIAELKSTVLEAAQNGSAEVETPRLVKSSEIDALYSKAGRNMAFILTHPENPKHRVNTPTKRQTKTPKKSPSKAMDPRQLDMLINSKSKGDA